MKLSLDWINDFVDLSNIDPKSFAERITLSVAEVEDVEVIERSVREVLVGEVLEVQPLAGPKGRALATVSFGRDTAQTVCGAPNVRRGMKAAFAPIGTVLAGGKRVEAVTIDSHASRGVLCSAAELGLSRWHEELLECPDDLAPGTPLIELIPERDVIIDIDNKSLTHRPDLWGHYGFAREIAAVLRTELRPLPVADLSRYDLLPAYPISVEDPESCAVYSAIEMMLGSRAVRPSPLLMQRRLHAVGQRTHSLLVDVTNYLMLELAQPTHAFDAARVSGVRVARPERNLTFTTLDGQARAVTSSDLLIWSGDRALALAGIMGGAGSEVGPETTRVLLESANFTASRVRRTSMRLGLRTDSSQRFEKGQPRSVAKRAAERFVRLLELADVTPEVTSRFSSAGDFDEAPRTIRVRSSFISERAGADISANTTKRILESLGFGVQAQGGDLVIQIPAHRSPADISIDADIVEEVLRIYGYDRIAPRAPETAMSLVDLNDSLRAQHKARRVLSEAHGFVEVHTYGWTDDLWLGTLGFDPGPHVLELSNPAAAQLSRMRTTLLPNLLGLIRNNRDHRDDFRLYELGRVFRLNAEGKKEEESRLSGVSVRQSREAGPQEHIEQIKAALEDVAKALGGHALDIVPLYRGREPWLAAGHGGAIIIGGVELGTFGILDREMTAKVVRGGHVVWFDLAIEAVPSSVYPKITYQPLPTYPSSWRDYSLVWSSTDYRGLVQQLDAYVHPLAQRRELIYVYRGKGLEPGTASYTIRYWLGAPDHTLTAAEIEQFHEQLLNHLRGRSIATR